MNKRAFTLVELLVVIAIIAIVMGVVRPMLSQSSSRAREFECESHLRQIAVALHAYASDYGVYPGSLEALDSIIRDRDILVCPRTGAFYHYRAPGPKAPPDRVVVCCVDPRRAENPWPHGGGERRLALTAGGKLRVILRR